MKKNILGFWYVFTFVLLSVATFNIWSLTFIRSPLYKKEMDVLKRIGKALDQNWVEYLNSVNALEETVDSYIDNVTTIACQPELATINSKVDYQVGIPVEMICSKLDVLEFGCQTAESAVDGIDQSFTGMSSQLDVISVELVSIESKIDNWVGPLDYTISSKIDVASIESISIESKLDHWVGPIVETIDSKVDQMIASFPNEKSSELTRLILSKGEIITGPSYSITQDGLYTLTANTSGCITVDADNVTIDLNGFTLYCDQQNAVIEIFADNKNIQIINGKLQGSAALDNDGILTGSACSLINLENIKMFSCNNGIRFSGLDGAIESCKVQDCEFKSCNVGCRLIDTKNTVIENCLAFGCFQRGFDLIGGQYNVCNNCKALNIENDETDQDAIGFASSFGTGNLFTECFVEGARITNVASTRNALGFLFENSETESKIINSVVNSTENISTTSIAYGILLESGVTKCLIDSNKVCNTSAGGGTAVGISGDSSQNYFIRNLAYDNDTNYSVNVVDVYTGGLGGSPDLLNNISLPSDEMPRGNSDLLETIDSKLDVAMVGGIDVISSKLDVASAESISIESKLDHWVGPISETIDSKMDIANIELVSIESKLDKWVGPLTETIHSKVDNVITDLANYTENLEKLVLTTGEIITGPSYSITQDGLYTVTGNLISCITVDADDVIIDLGGFTVSCDTADAAIEILPGHSNVHIKNGKLQGSAALDNDGILTGSACSLINLENIKTFSCDNGIRFAGTSGDMVQNCKIKDCECNTCNAGCSFDYTKNTVIQNCIAFGCYQKGFEQTGCQYNVCSNCKALNIENDQTDQRAIGFVSSFGTGNLFTECFAEGVRLNNDTSLENVYGFLFENSETESKIINSVANSTENLSTTSIAYGILLESGVTKCLIDSNKVCNTSAGGGTAVGISGDSSQNYFIRNLAYDNDTNYSTNVVDVYTGGLGGSPDLLDNISLPSDEMSRGNSELIITIDSKVDQLGGNFDLVSSKLDIANNLFVTVESRIDVVVGPLAETIDSNVDVANIESVAIESKLDQWIGLLSETINSKVDLLFEPIVEVQNLLISKGGIIKTGENIITQEGVYKLGANITGYISIQASDVIVDLSGFTLDYSASGSAVIEVSSGLDNIEIINGKIKSNGSLDGILVGPGCELIMIDNIRIFDCDNGINFNGGSGSNNIKACEIKNCQIKSCTKGVVGTYLIKSLFDKCHVLNCVETGFDLTSSEYNVLDNCFALETEGTVAGTRAIGFFSSQGRGNLFRECVAEGTTKTTSSFDNGAYGFLLTGTENAMETESKIIDCVANSSQVLTGTGGAFGVCVEPVYLSGTLSPLAFVENQSGSSFCYNAVHWSPNEKYLAVGYQSGVANNVQVFSWDGQELKSIGIYAFANSDRASGVRWSPDGNYLAVGGGDAASVDELEVLSFNGSALAKIDGVNIGHTVYAIDWSPDGNYLAAGALGTVIDVSVFRFDGSSLTPVTSATFDPGFTSVLGVEWSPNGKYLAVTGAYSGGNDLIILYFDGADLIDNGIGAETGTGSVSWSPDGKYLGVSGTNPAKILHFNGASLSSVGTYNTVLAYSTFSPDGKYFVVTGDGTGTANDIEVLKFNGSSLTFVPGAGYNHGGRVFSVDWSPSGKYIATVGDQSSVGGTSVNLRVFEVMEGPTGCVIDGNKTCNGTGSTQGSIGILGSGDNIYTRNIGSGNSANFNKALYNRSGDALQNTPKYYDNIWLPGFYPGFNQ